MKKLALRNHRNCLEGTISRMASVAKKSGAHGWFLSILAVMLLMFDVAAAANVKASSKKKLITLPLMKNTAPHQRRLIASMGKAQELAAMYQDDGEHYVDMWCGSPVPQRQTLLVVTGVSPGASGFPCSDCDGECGKYNHVDSLYKDGQSKTFRVLKCNECVNGHCPTGGDRCSAGMDYPSGDFWRGYEVSDKCYLGGRHDEPVILDKDWAGYDDIDFKKASALTFDFKFACQTKITGVFNNFMADGILSMDSTSGSFWGQMYDAGRIPERKFTLCYRRAREFNSSGTHAGAMTLGGADTRLHTSDMVMSLLDSESSSNWKVKIRKIHLRGGGGESARSANAAATIKTLPLSDRDFDAYPAYLDSGYTNTFLSSVLADAFNKAWKELTGNTYTTYPKSMSEKERDSLPTILFQLVGDEVYNREVLTLNSGEAVGLVGRLDPEHPLDVLVAVPPSHYMKLSAGSDNRYGATIFEAGDREASATVLGANFMRGHDILFNVEDQRLGWAESPCDYTDLVSEYYNGTYGEIPWSKKSGKASSRKKSRSSNSNEKGSGNVCRSGFCGGTFFFLLLLGGVIVIGVQIHSRRTAARGRILYQDLPTGLELRERDDEQEVVFYEPPSSAY